MGTISDEVRKWLEFLAKALGILLYRIAGIREKNPDDGYKEVKQYFNEECDIDLDYILSLNNDQMLKYLKEKRFNHIHLENFAAILFEMNDFVKQNENRINVLEKAKFIFNELSKKDKAYSIERENKIKK